MLGYVFSRVLQSSCRARPRAPKRYVRSHPGTRPFPDWALGCHLRLAERRIDLPGYPKVVEQNSQSSGDPDYRPLPSILTRRRMEQTPASKVTIWPSVTEDVLGAIDKQVA